MLLVHLVEDYWIDGRKGGGARYPYELVRALDAQGSNLEQLVVGVGDLSDEEGRPQVLHPTKYPLTDSQLEEVVASASHVLAHNVHSIALMEALRLTASRPTQLSVIDHGGVSIPRSSRLRIRAAYKKIDVFFGVSNFSLDVVGAPADKRVAVYGGGDHIRRGQAGQLLDKVDFTFIGRVMPHKGLELLLRSCPDSAKLRVIGPASTWHTSFGEKIYSSLEERGHHAVRDADEPTLRSALEATRYLVMPTMSRVGLRPLRRPDLLGLVMLEAAEMGVPTIASTAGALKEVAPMVGGEAIRAGSLKEWHRALERAQVTDHATPTISPLCTWKSCATSILERLQQVS